MAFEPPKGWKRESDTLFTHANGAQIQRRAYREKEGWFLIPPDLDQEVLGFDPTPEGREKAFTAFTEAKLKRPKKTSTQAAQEVPKPKRGRKPKPRPDSENAEEDSTTESASGEDVEDEDDS